MKYSQFLAGAAVAAVANAHATIMHAWINDVDQGLGNSAAGYIRSPPNNNPLKDITSSDMTCNVNNVATAKTLEVAPGDKITLEWHHDSDAASDDIIDGSHVGPLLAYLAPTESNGAGDVWVKIAEDGYDGSTWAVTTLIANKGKWDVTIPSTLAAGEYLLRGEIIALHEADVAYSANSARGAQFYMECVQIKVSGTGATALPAGVAIPGAYSYTDPGVVFNVYGSFTSYTIPGPAVWDGTSSGSTAPVASSAAAPVASSTAAPIASSAAAPVVSSSVAPVATSAPATSATTDAAPIVSSVASDLVPIATSVAPVTTSAAAPVASSTKSACKPKTTTVAPAPTKSACSAKSSAATTLATVAKPVASSGASVVAKYGQCGGTGYTGSTTCAEGSTCNAYNPYYSQCI